MDLRLVVLGLVDLEISAFEISGFVAAPSLGHSKSLIFGWLIRRKPWLWLKV